MNYLLTFEGSQSPSSSLYPYLFSILMPPPQTGPGNSSCGGVYFLAPCSSCVPPPLISSPNFTLPATFRSFKNWQEAKYEINLEYDEFAVVAYTSDGSSWSWEDSPFDETMMTPRDPPDSVNYVFPADFNLRNPASDYSGSSACVDDTGTMMPEPPAGKVFRGCICENYTIQNCNIPSTWDDCRTDCHPQNWDGILYVREGSEAMHK